MFACLRCLETVATYDTLCPNCREYPKDIEPWEYEERLARLDEAFESVPHETR